MGMGKKIAKTGIKTVPRPNQENRVTTETIKDMRQIRKYAIEFLNKARTSYLEKNRKNFNRLFNITEMNASCPLS